MYTNCLLTEIRLFSTKLVFFLKKFGLFFSSLPLNLFFILKGATERLFDGLYVLKTQQKVAEKDETPQHHILYQISPFDLNFRTRKKSLC